MLGTLGIPRPTVTDVLVLLLAEAVPTVPSVCMYNVAYTTVRVVYIPYPISNNPCWVAWIEGTCGVHYLLGWHLTHPPQSGNEHETDEMRVAVGHGMANS